jgi:hypothetical protein
MMRLLAAWVCPLLVTAVAAAQAPLPTAPTDFNNPTTLVQALRSPDAEYRYQAVEHAPEAGVAAISVVAPLLDQQDPAVVQGAKLALERIVGPATAQPETRVQAVNALIGSALAVKNRDWLLWLLSYSGGGEVVPALGERLRGAPPEGRDAILRVLECMAAAPYAEADTAAIAAVVEQVLVPMLQQAEPAHQVALINALGALQQQGAVPALLEVAEGGGPNAVSAYAALARLGAREVGKPLLRVLQQSKEPAVLHAYLVWLEQQPPASAAKAYAQLLKLYGSPGTSAQAAAVTAALQGLSKQAGGTRNVKRFVTYLNSARADVSGAARNALIASTEDINPQLMRAAKKEKNPMRRALLVEILAERKAPGHEALLEEALDDPEHEVRTAAITQIGRSANPALAPRMLELAKAAGGGPELTAALLAYATTADATLAGGDAPAAMPMYHATLELAQSDDVRARALSGITAIASPESLPLLEAARQQAGVANQVVAAQLAIAEKLQATDAPQAESLLRAAIESTSEPELARRAEAGLRALGVQEDFAKSKGFLLDWQIIGPFPAEKFTDTFTPETVFDTTLTYQGVDNRQVPWKQHHVADVLGMTSLGETVGHANNAIAYARAEFTSPAEQDAVLKLGSDDGVIVWLNGAEVHRNNAARGLQPDQDTVPVHLKAGPNVLLLKIFNKGSDWGFVARLVDAAGKPLIVEAVPAQIEQQVDSEK